MCKNNLYNELAVRTDGAVMLGVIGPVRTGKATFIKRFMETLVIPRIDNNFLRERAKDELPQSASGKTIMTAEPKFVPENAVTIRVGENTELSVRLVDCVGYMVEGAAGQFEDGHERMVTTPWFDHEVTITEAAEKGTWKVINEHSSIGIVVTTDGSIGEIPRESYESAEERTITELKEIGKPFVVLLNSTAPKSERCTLIAREIAEKYGVRCLPVDCLHMTEEDIGVRQRPLCRQVAPQLYSRRRNDRYPANQGEDKAWRQNSTSCRCRRYRLQPSGPRAARRSTALRRSNRLCHR